MRLLNFKSSHVLLIIVIVGMQLLSVQSPVQAQQGINFNNLIRATVYLSSVVDTPGGPAISCTGSGTIVASDGFILTNAHLVVDSNRCPVDRIAVSLTVQPDEPPIMMYYADLKTYDLGLDLAVLQITRQIDGRLIPEGTLRFPFVALGDSEQLTLDDTISVFGYEDIGDDSVTLSRGTVIGFIGEPRGEDRAWLKTSATILGTMSGGGAYNAFGQLVGVPTTAPASAEEAVVDCRSVQDTNGDGQVDGRDDCMPVGGFINALRPVHLASGLVQAAQLGLHDEGHIVSNVVEAAEQSTVEQPEFGPIRVAPSINEAGQPTTFVSSLPSGASSMYVVFDYSNMRPGLVYELRTTRNGTTSTDFSQSPALWPGSSSGLWYIGTSGRVLQNGTYAFTLLIEGRVVQTAQVTVGGAPTADETFSDVSFGLLDLQGNDTQVGYVLGVGDIITAQFIYRNMVDGSPWSAVWYYEGIEIRRDDGVWDRGPSGAHTINIRPESGGLLPGRFRLELTIRDELVAMGGFILAGGQDGVFARIYENFRFSSELEAGQPAGIISSSFSNPPQNLYAFVDWRSIGAGTPWTYRWLVDGDIFYESYEPWVAPGTGADFWLQLSSDTTLPDGSYTLEILVGGQIFVSEVARVGLGQLPVSAGSDTEGIQLSGAVVDAQTGEGVPGVLLIILEAEFSIEDFLWDESQVFARTLTDRNGRFEVDRLLPLDDFYSVLFMADGYLPVAVDGIFLDPEPESAFLIEEFADSQLDLRLELNRDLVQ